MQVLFCISKALWSQMWFVLEFSGFQIFPTLSSLEDGKTVWQEVRGEGCHKFEESVFNWHLLTSSRLVFVALVYMCVVLVVTHLLFWLVHMLGCSVFFRTWLGFKEPWGLYLLLDSHSFCRFCLQICFSQRRIQEVLKTCPVNFVYENVKLFTLCAKFDTFCQLFSKITASKVEGKMTKMESRFLFNSQTKIGWRDRQVSRSHNWFL